MVDGWSEWASPATAHWLSSKIKLTNSRQAPTLEGRSLGWDTLSRPSQRLERDITEFTNGPLLDHRCQHEIDEVGCGHPIGTW